MSFRKSVLTSLLWVDEWYCAPGITGMLMRARWRDERRRKYAESLEMFKLSGRDNPLRRELWRLQDLREGGGLQVGFITEVELFFLALRQPLSASSSKESHSALLVGTFQAITPDWNKYKSSLGTQKLLEWVVSDNDIIFHPLSLTSS